MSSLADRCFHKVFAITVYLLLGLRLYDILRGSWTSIAGCEMRRDVKSPLASSDLVVVKFFKLKP
jgi:hypothetical protein